MAKRVRGNLSPELIQGALRQGDNNVVQMFGGGSPTAGHVLVFDAAGNAIDGGAPGAATSGVIGITIDGAGSVPATGAKGFIQIPYACTINAWTMLADVSGSAQITVSKGAYSAYPTVASIVAAAQPKITAAQKATSSTLTGWTVAISANDVLTFNLDSVATCTRIVLEIQVTRT